MERSPGRCSPSVEAMTGQPTVLDGNLTVDDFAARGGPDSPVLHISAC